MEPLVRWKKARLFRNRLELERKKKQDVFSLLKKYDKSRVLKDFVYIWKTRGTLMEFKENLFLIILLLH